MPLGDRTGPTGMGPGTGRAIGYCQGFDSPGYNRGPGRGMGRGGRSGYGRGMGRGQGFMAGRGQDSMTGRGRDFMPARGRGFSRQGFTSGYPAEMPAMNKDEQIRILKSHMEYLSNEQKNIEKRLNELGKE